MKKCVVCRKIISISLSATQSVPKATRVGHQMCSQDCYRKFRATEVKHFILSNIHLTKEAVGNMRPHKLTGLFKKGEIDKPGISKISGVPEAEIINADLISSIDEFRLGQRYWLLIIETKENTKKFNLEHLTAELKEKLPQ